MIKNNTAPGKKFAEKGAAEKRPFKNNFAESGSASPVGITAREAAFRSLEACRKDGKYPNLEVNSALNKTGLDGAEKNMYTALVYGVTERIITLDYIIDHYASGRVDHSARCALRLGLYQLKYMDRVPDHAAVSESVALVKKPVRGFVNAVLRAFIRDGKNIPDIPANLSPAVRMSIEYSVSEELADLWIRCYGEETASALLSAALKREDPCIRVNTAKVAVNEAARRISDAGICVSQGRLPGILRVSSVSRISSGIDSGDWIVQDEASALAVYALSPSPGETIVDTCAAPGGKSFAAAMEMNGKGKIYSFDLHKNKISLIESGAQKLGFENIIHAECRDVRNPDPALIGRADRVLCDVPCSGFGVIGKKPDIKYKSLSDISRLPEIQYDVLESSSSYVKQGGILVYSTCTVNPAENEDVVNRFLSNHSEFEACPFSSPFGDHCSGMAQLMMHVNGTDGFFVAKLRRH